MGKYIEFLGGWDKSDIEEKVYNAENIKLYIKYHSWTNKSLLIVHMNSILNVLENTKTDVRSSISSINLKNRLDFKELLPNTSKKCCSYINVFTIDNFIKLVNIHNSSIGSKHDVFSCFAILQAAMGLRFNNLDHLVQTSKIVIYQKNCQKCSKYSTSEHLTSACISQLKFKQSKTGSFSTYIIPNVLKCFEFVNSTNVSNLNYNLYSKFIKVNFGMTSHCLRKFLPNICIANRNTAAWRNVNNLSKFYLADFTKYGELVNLMLNHMPEIKH